MRNNFKEGDKVVANFACVSTPYGFSESRIKRGQVLTVMQNESDGLVCFYDALGKYDANNFQLVNKKELSMDKEIKKGDFVRIKGKNGYVSAGYGYTFTLHPSGLFKVKEISGSYIRIECGKYSGHWWPMNEFEIVKQSSDKEMKTEEFKTGDKVFVTNGEKYHEGKILDTEHMFRDQSYILVKYQSVAGTDSVYLCSKDGRLHNYSNWSIAKEPPFDWAALWAAVPSWHDEIVCQPNGKWTSRKDVGGTFEYIYIPKELAPPFTKDLDKIYKRPS